MPNVPNAPTPAITPPCQIAEAWAEIRTHDHVTRYRRAGTGRAVVVLDAADGEPLWPELIAALAERFRLIVPEVPPAAVDLPVHLTRFIGRDRELEDLARLVGEARLLTLTGAGGSGKTRLAREAASNAAGSFRRVCWVDLAPLADPALVAQQV